jgi:DNA-binding response OmpR family regulator
VLIVEDYADSADVLKLILTIEGHQVDVTATVAETTALIGQTWDVVISDLGLPDGTGFDVARWLRGREAPPRLLIALSGYNSPEDVARSHEAGFDKHLVKPVDPQTLIALLRRVAAN